MGIPRRFIPWAIVNDLSGVGYSSKTQPGRCRFPRAPRIRRLNLIGFLDAFKAGPGRMHRD